MRSSTGLTNGLPLPGGLKAARAAIPSAEHVYQPNNDADDAYDNQDNSRHIKQPVEPPSQHGESQKQQNYPDHNNNSPEFIIGSLGIQQWITTVPA